MELYIHIPFCVKKCEYCDFLSFDNCFHNAEAYVAALKKDIANEANKCQEPLETIFIGGGTPSSIDATQVCDILNTVFSYFNVIKDCEITIEVNPCTVTLEKMLAYKNAGINRISMGVQSFNDSTLKTLGRAHDSKTAKEALKIINAAGFDNVSIDLISCVPGESEESFFDSLEFAVKQNLKHISIYQLIIEKGTSFYNKYGPESGFCFDEDYEANNYEKTVDFLKCNGFEQYEISNFSKPGFASKHNLGYWEQKSYIGVGLGATGTRYHFGDNSYAKRYRKATSFEEYFEDQEAMFTELISNDELKAEFIMLGLRKNNGISFNEYADIFGERLPEEKINRCIQIGSDYVTVDDSGIHLTTKGMLISNYIINELI